jgi:hypothetical protein
MRFLLYLILIAAPAVSNAQFGNRFVVANLRSVNFTAIDKSTLMENPASLAGNDSACAAFSIIPSRFGIADLNHSELSSAFEIAPGFKGGAMIAGGGGSLHSEISAVAAGSYRFDDKIDVGAKVSLNRFSAKNYGSAFAISFGFGSKIKITDGLNFGFVLENLNRPTFDGGENTALQRAAFGAGIELADNFFIDADANIIINEGSGLGISGRYDAAEFLSFNAGYFTNPGELFFGAAVSYSGFRFSFQPAFHSELGLSTRLAVVIDI